MSGPLRLGPVGGDARRPTIVVAALATALVAAGLVGQLGRPVAPPSTSPATTVAVLLPSRTDPPRSFALPTTTPWPRADLAVAAGPAHIIAPSPDPPVTGSGALHIEAEDLPERLGTVLATVSGPAGPLTHGLLTVGRSGRLDAWLRMEPDPQRAQALTLTLSDAPSGRTLGRQPFVLGPAIDIVPSLPFLPGARIGRQDLVVEGLLRPGIWTVGIWLRTAQGNLSSTAEAFIDRTHSPAIVEFMAALPAASSLGPGPATLCLQGFDPQGQPLGRPVDWPLMLGP